MKKLQNLVENISFDNNLSYQDLFSFLMKSFSQSTEKEIYNNLSKYGIQKLIEIAKTLQIITVESICEQIYCFLQKKKMEKIFIKPKGQLNIQEFIDNYSESKKDQFKIAMKLWDIKTLLKFAKKIAVNGDYQAKLQLLEEKEQNDFLIQQILEKLSEIQNQKLQKIHKIDKQFFVSKYSKMLSKPQSIDKLFQISSQDGPGFLYVIYEKKMNVLPQSNDEIFEYKIGMTQALPDRRIQILEKNNKKEYVVKQSFETSHRKLLEKLVHCELSDYHIPKEQQKEEHKDGKTEWFKTNFYIIKAIILNCKQAISKVWY